MRTIKHLLAILCLFVSCAVSNAQNTSILNRLPKFRKITAENQALRNKLDSLTIELELLKEELAQTDNLQEEILEAMDEINPSDSVMLDTDSLLSLWYLQRSMKDDYSEFELFDSLELSSNVSDSVLIKRLEKMNSYITLPYNETVRNYMVLYTEKMPAKMPKMLSLSDYYFPIFEEVLNRYGLPDELKMMSVIESALDPVAKSRAGAQGIWQFMLKTAKLYGLKINSYVDERLDPWKATDAAARYLLDSYNIFGDWNLAISSYNCGAGNVNKAIKRSGGKTGFWDIYPYLPRETRGYVPAFVGATYAFNYYKEYGIVPEQVQMPAEIDTFEIRRNLHFKQISDVINVPMETLQALNPQYIKDVIPGNEATYILRLPYNYSSAFVENVDSIYRYKLDQNISSGIMRELSSGNAVKNGETIQYKVKSGDYLGKIASRYHVTVSQIKSWNNLKNNNLRVGQVLTIYGSSGTAAATTTKVTASSTTRTQTAPAKKGTNVSTPGSRTLYVVKSGDSLYSIAKNFPGISAENIREANNLPNTKLKIGQKLVIPEH